MGFGFRFVYYLKAADSWLHRLHLLLTYKHIVIMLTALPNNSLCNVRDIAFNHSYDAGEEPIVFKALTAYAKGRSPETKAVVNVLKNMFVSVVRKQNTMKQK